MKTLTGKVLIKKDKTEGYGNVLMGKLLISYELPFLFLDTATIEEIASLLGDDQDKESLIKNWKLKKATISFNL